MPSAYILFSKEETRRLKQKQEFVHYDAKKLNRLIATKWRIMSDEEKQQYKDEWQRLNDERKNVESKSRRKVMEDDDEDEKLASDSDGSLNNDVEVLQEACGGFSKSMENRRKKIKKKKQNKSESLINDMRTSAINDPIAEEEEIYDLEQNFSLSSINEKG